MIRFSNQVPSIYTNASRDFQYLGWLIDIVLNSIKHNIDNLYKLPILTEDARLTELLAMTLGFKVKRNYDKTQLAALVSILPSILRYKGTESAVRMAAEVLIKSSGAIGDFSITVNGAQINVVLPEELVDVTLFIDLLDYILPAGMTCRVIRNTQLKKDLEDVQVKYYDEVYFEQHVDLGWSQDNQSIGLSSLLDPEKASLHEFAANFTSDEFDNRALNAGLLSNTVIPILSNNDTLIPDEEEFHGNMVDSHGRYLVSADDKLLLAKENE